MAVLTYSADTRKTILQIFGKDIDDEGYIIESGTRNRVLTPEGNEIAAKDLGGIRPGSEIFFTNDLPSLIKYASDLED